MNTHAFVFMSMTPKVLVRGRSVGRSAVPSGGAARQRPSASNHPANIMGWRNNPFFLSPFLPRRHGRRKAAHGTHALAQIRPSPPSLPFTAFSAVILEKKYSISVSHFTPMTAFLSRRHIFNSKLHLPSPQPKLKTKTTDGASVSISRLPFDFTRFKFKQQTHI